MPARAFDLLVIDDDIGQVHLLQVLLKELGLAHRCHHVLDGNAALDFLNRCTPFQQAPRPQLILLDLNLPEMSGCEVLHEIKRHPDLCLIPVIIFSQSRSAEDVQACYREHANCYISKPRDLEANLQVVDAIDRFWLQSAALPG